MKKSTLFHKKLYKALRRLESEYYDLIYMEDAETIHDLRVSIRRVTPLLDVFIQGIDNKKSKNKLIEISKTFKAYFKALSEVRDQQIMIPRLVEMHPSSLSILTKMDNDLKVLHRNILMQASEWDIPGQIDTVILLAFASTEVKLNTEKHVNTQLKQGRKHLKHLLKKGLGNADQLHHFRIALKKYRYIIEMAESLHVSSKVSSKTIKIYQDELGVFQDLTVLKNYIIKTQPHLPLLADIIQMHDETCIELIESSKRWHKTLKI